VGALVPDGFEAYGRLLHPAYSREDGHVPWSRMAAWGGRSLEPTSYFGGIAIRGDGIRWHALGSGPPDGEFPGGAVPAAGGGAGRVHLHAGGRFALWNGWGDFEIGEDDESAVVEITPRITSSGRRYLLYRGPLRSITRLRFFGGSFRPPSFWWPEDRSWFVATEVDAVSTYVGGTGTLIERLRATDGLEVLPAGVDDPFDGTHPGQASWRS